MIRGLAFIFAFVVVINLGLLASGLLWRGLCRAVRAWRRRRRQRRTQRFIAPRRPAFRTGDGILAHWDALRLARLYDRDWEGVLADLARDREIARALRGGIDWPGAA